MKKLFYFVLLFAFVFILSWVFRNFYFSAESQKHISGAYDALNFWSLQRAYPHSSIPDVANYAAFEYSRQNLRGDLDNSLSVTPWQPIGPVNLGGRTLTIAFNPLNPNTIYAGSASGGLWRSYSGGRGTNAWENVPTGFPVLGVSSIAFAPGDSNTIYIGTGEVYNYQNVGHDPAFRSTRGSYGIGILKTTDGGLTWSKSLDWSYNQRNGVWAVRVNPLNPNTVWAATTEGTYKSTNAGASWSLVHNVIMGMDLVINPVDTNTVFVSCGNFQSSGYGIYRTTDGGVSWTKL
ncbi:MAG: WD40/YVTN/BNR-like repeat-containing protein, partial [Calditrichia bacterium]